jgi:hypothetical protein
MARFPAPLPVVLPPCASGPSKTSALWGFKVALSHSPSPRPRRAIILWGGEKGRKEVVNRRLSLAPFPTTD